MSALDRFYDFTLNLPDAKLTSKAMSLCNIDRNVFNIYLTLQKGKNNPILNADLSNYTVTMTVVKPKTKEYVEKVGVIDGSNDRLLFELGETFNDQIGSYKGEIKVQNGDEVITSSSFAYTVTQSLISGLNAEIEANPDVEVLRQLINEVKAAVGMTPEDPDSLLTDYQKKTDETLTTTNKTIIGAINENSSQIKDNVKYIDVVAANESMIGYVENQESLKPLITFVDDDGRDGTYEIIKDICQQYNIPFVIALYSKSTITDEQGLELQNEYGCEITGHSMSHSFLHTLNEEQLEYELGENKRELLKKGYNVSNFVYPQNTHNELVHKVARKYYNCACTVGTDQTNKMNEVTNFGLLRVAMGTFCQEGKDNLAYYKSMVDKCISEKSWLIFMTHVSWETHTQAMTQDIKDTISYIKSKNVDIVTLQEGWEHFGNKVEIRSTMGEHILTNKGQTISTVFDRAKINAPNFNAPITEYARGKMTRTNFLSSDSTGFPHNATGVLETYRDIYTSYHDNSFQIWHPYNSNKIYKRIWDDTTNSWLEWGEFITSDIVDYKIAQSVIVQNLNSTSYVSTTPINSFPNNKVTITVIPASRANGFPRNAAGLLTTYRFGGNGYDYQEYKEYAENRKWIRTTNPDGTWGEWKELSNV